MQLKQQISGHAKIEMQQCKSTASILTLMGKAGQLAYASHAVSSQVIQYAHFSS